MTTQKIHNAAGKLVGILYIDDNKVRIEIVKDRCKTTIFIIDGEIVRVESYFIDRA